MAITRAVGKIEHEAAMQSQRVDTAAVGESARKRVGGTGRGRKKVEGKRPPVKASLSGEQVHGLMS